MPTSIAEQSQILPLESFLRELGLHDPQVKLVRDAGIGSLVSLQRACRTTERKQALLKKIRGAKPDLMHEQTAEAIEDLEADAVQARIDRATGRGAAQDSKAFNKTKAQLSKAIGEVDALREACLTAAGAERDALVKSSHAELERILAQCKAKDLLASIDGSFASLEKLTATLEQIENGLQDKIAEKLEEFLDRRPRAIVELLDEKQLLRGFCVTAASLEQASGSDVLAMGGRLLRASGLSNVQLDYSSEQASKQASQRFETSASSLGASASAKGAAFVGSGIGAFSLMANYAAAQQNQSQDGSASARQIATRIKTHYRKSQQAVMDLPSDQLAFSEAALSGLRGLDAIPAEQPAQRRAAAEFFMRSFGSHVFCQAILGGWYKYEAKASSTSSESQRSLDEAVSRATDWAISASASYSGFGGSGSAAAAGRGGSSQASAGSSVTHYKFNEQSVAVSVAVLGGMAELPSDLWLASLKPDAQWQVIDRSHDKAVWEILRLPQTSAQLGGLAAPACAKLAELLEDVWVNEIFIPSVELPGLRQHLINRGLKTASALAREIRSMTQMPGMRLALFEKHFVTPTERLEATLELPPGYKILGGGAAADVKQEPGNFLVASHPSVVGTGKAQRWGWHALIKHIGQISKVQHVIRVVALYDPADEWDVRIFNQSSAKLESNQGIKLAPNDGYLFTGGGGKVHESDKADTAVLCAMSYCPAGENVGPPQERCHYFVASTHLTKTCPHQLTAYAIGLRPRGSARLAWEYRMHSFGQAAHHNHVIQHLASGDGLHRTVMIGGGVMMSPLPVSNGLTGSCPLPYPESGHLAQPVYAWHGTSKDHANPAPAAMSSFTLALTNVDFEWIEPGTSP